MTRQSVSADIESILTDRTLQPEEQIKALERMHDEIRAQMRAATESNMVEDNTLGEELRLIEEALEGLKSAPDADTDTTDDNGPATL